MYFAIIYYGNLTYKSTLSRNIYIIFNVLGIVQVLLMDYLLNITNNNIDILISIYFVISIIALDILSIISKELNDRIDKMIQIETKESIFLPLSYSERLIAELMIKDYSNGEIAKTVCLSPNTVKFHIKSILKKLNVNNKKELIRLINNLIIFKKGIKYNISSFFMYDYWFIIQMLKKSRTKKEYLCYNTIMR